MTEVVFIKLQEISLIYELNLIIQEISLHSTTSVTGYLMRMKNCFAPPNPSQVPWLGTNQQLRYVPWLASNLQPFSTQDNAPTNWATPAGQVTYFLMDPHKKFKNMVSKNYIHCPLLITHKLENKGDFCFYNS